MKHIMGRLQNTYNDLKDEKEIAIYDKYANIAKRITFAFIGEKSIIMFHYCDFINFHIYYLHIYFHIYYFTYIFETN